MSGRPDNVALHKRLVRLLRSRVRIGNRGTRILLGVEPVCVAEEGVLTVIGKRVIEINELAQHRVV